MRRFLFVFLLIWFPLQMSWAAVVGYCQHETGSGANHVGHHQRSHDVSKDGGKEGGAAAQDHQGGDTKKVGIDGDCATCHLSPLPPLTSQAAQPAVESSETWVSRSNRGHPSHIPQGLERPDRRHNA
ncbi:MAG: hypothetical protein V4532_07260 [Pseudomonadota bacterium]|uniref:hypothetical protein n=1 Tax=Aquabacterium sp. CECT 9606 TaxID=2845822 RepID=UPI001E5DCCDF|nr:hypothetical protein [Aquabacterium sp. CECT 9606]CAH0353395.1 hypothetical protein AQB9606_03209 [Aquabacterium sp. CECT 9606]